MPDHLQQVAASAPEAEQMAAQRITLQHLLHQERKAGEALPHVGMARGKPHPHPGRQRDHRARPPDNAATAAVNVAGSTAPVIRSCTPLAKAISIILPVPARAVHAGCSGATETAANCTSSSCRNAAAGPMAPVRACRRQTVRRLGCTSCRRATSTTLAEAAWLSSTIRSFSTVVHRRRRSGPDRTETLLSFAHLLICLQINQQTIAGKVVARKAALTEGLLCSILVCRSFVSGGPMLQAKNGIQVVRFRISSRRSERY